MSDIQQQHRQTEWIDCIFRIWMLTSLSTLKCNNNYYNKAVIVFIFGTKICNFPAKSFIQLKGSHKKSQLFVKQVMLWNYPNVLYKQVNPFRGTTHEKSFILQIKRCIIIHLIWICSRKRTTQNAVSIAMLQTLVRIFCGVVSAAWVEMRSVSFISRWKKRRKKKW